MCVCLNLNLNCVMMIYVDDCVCKVMLDDEWDEEMMVMELVK